MPFALAWHLNQRRYGTDRLPMEATPSPACYNFHKLSGINRRLGLRVSADFNGAVEYYGRGRSSVLDGYFSDSQLGQQSPSQAYPLG